MAKVRNFEPKVLHNSVNKLHDSRINTKRADHKMTRSFLNIYVYCCFPANSINLHSHF